MSNSIDHNLETMSSAERRDAIDKLTKILDEIERYANYYFWKGRGRAYHETHLVIHMGTDVVRFDSTYYESYRNCYYSKTLTFNGKRTTRTRIRNIVEKLKILEQM